MDGRLASPQRPHRRQPHRRDAGAARGGPPTRVGGCPCHFTLLVPRPFWDADTEESAITLELAIPLLEEAAGGRVEGLLGAEDPFLAVSAAAGGGAVRRGHRLDASRARVALAAHRSARARGSSGSPGHGRHRQEGGPPSRGGHSAGRMIENTSSDDHAGDRCDRYECLAICTAVPSESNSPSTEKYRSPVS